MAFPTTPILDAFTRSNGGLGSNWTSPVETGDSTPQVYTNAVSGVSSLYNSAYWNAATFLDSECYLTMPAGASSTDSVYLYMRSNAEGTGTARCYALVDTLSGGLDLYRQYNNSFSSSLVNFGSSVLYGNKIGMEVTTVGGDILIRCYKDVGGGWVQQGSTYTDTGAVATYPNLNSSGHIGFNLYGDGVASAGRQIDDFGGGTIVPPTVISMYTPKAMGKVN